jgi:hypothetical protein
LYRRPGAEYHSRKTEDVSVWIQPRAPGQAGFEAKLFEESHPVPTLIERNLGKEDSLPLAFPDQ